MGAGMARLEVTFLVDADGILHVTAREQTTGKEASIEVKPSYGLSEEQIEKMLLESYEYAETDLKQRMLIEARVEAERILAALHGAMQADSDLLTDEEKGDLAAIESELEQAMRGNNHRVVRELTEKLDLRSKPFAERRMNRSMGRAVAGHDVTEIEKKVEHAVGTEHHGQGGR
jgi:molecular chaperone HscA